MVSGIQHEEVSIGYLIEALKGVLIIFFVDGLERSLNGPLDIGF